MLHSRPNKADAEQYGARGPYFIDLVDTVDGIGYPSHRPPMVRVIQLENEIFDFEEDDITPIIRDEDPSPATSSVEDCPEASAA